MNDLKKSRAQLSYFSKSYEKFEEDFYKYSRLNIPLTFLTDDILQNMMATGHSYFRLNGKNSKDGRDHYFIFKRESPEENKSIIRFSYLGSCLPEKFIEKFSTKN